MNHDFIIALSDIEKEKGISKDYMLNAIDAALTAAYKREYGSEEDVRVAINRENGDVAVYRRKHIVETVMNPTQELSVEEARKINIRADVGGIIEERIKIGSFGRIAAATAKQVMMQRIREAERSRIMNDFCEKENELLRATVTRVDKERKTVFVDLDGAEGTIPVNEQIPNEKYVLNAEMLVYVVEVRKGLRDPQIVVSRSHPGLVKRLFEMEVPEIQSGVVQIRSMAREAGSRTKMAVVSRDEQVDAIGACVGQRGARVEAVSNHLHGERVDIIRWSANPDEFIANALSPARVLMVQVNEEERAARVIVPDNQLSLAIGKEGQNARLAAKLTGWKIDIKSQSQAMTLMRQDVELGAED
ncbi:MAG: transcription termination factor NusA [Christensenellales bacterium]|jgi:N utilization substance protein A